MTSTRNQRIEQSLRDLEAAGFDVKALWREHTERIDRYERGTPSEDDLRYVLPDAPPNVESHFVDGVPQELSPGVMWEGFSYTLTKGQRALLRDQYNLTPTQTVTIVHIERWPSTAHPRSMKVVSDVHLDNRLRRHVLKEVVVRSVGEFFRRAVELDAESMKEKRFVLSDATLELGRIFDLESIERWAVEDLTGVKLSPRVELVGKSDERFVLLCQKTGNQAKVPRGEFFKTVEEYAKLHEYSKPKRARGTSKVELCAEVDALLREWGVER